MFRRTIILLLVVLLLCNGCGKVMEPPSVQEIEGTFEEFREEIQVVTDYLLSQEQSVSICSSSQELPKDVARAVKTLMRQAGCHSIHGNTAQAHFVLWTRFTDAGCGLMYSQAEAPDETLIYLTQWEPLSEPGWFYYVEDCNE